MKALLYIGIGFAGFYCFIAVMSGRAREREAAQMQRLMQVPPGGYPPVIVDRRPLPEQIKGLEEQVTRERQDKEFIMSLRK
jgi:hypothetical protein